MRNSNGAVDLEGERDLQSFISTGWSNWILHSKFKYYICCFRGYITKIERDLSTTIQNTSISGVTIQLDHPVSVCSTFYAM